jgi:DNA-binding MarR family transcriptional regulator
MNKQLVNRYYELAEVLARTALKCGDSELSVSEFSVLRIIEICTGEGRTATTTEMSRLLHISKPAVSRMLKTFEEKNYIERITDSLNRRSVAVLLTEKGWEVLGSNKTLILGRIERIMDRIGEEDSRHLVILMQRLADVIDDVK